MTISATSITTALSQKDEPFVISVSLCFWAFNFTPFGLNAVLSLFLMNDLTRKFNFLTWNVRGLNEVEKRQTIKGFLNIERPDVICLQETKLSNHTSQIIKETTGSQYTDYVVVDVVGSAGGITLAWKTRTFTKINHIINTYCVTVDLRLILDAFELRITGVYGPSKRNDRRVFFLKN